MRVVLSFLILCLFNKRPFFEQELAEENSKRKGDMPNPGTIHPSLRDLRKQEIMNFKKSSNKLSHN